ncbi:MAG: hypothetical protein IKS35_05575 [Clostridia bacterium]|nr:hypothetical protein [Clostridia bacterium]
MSNPTRHNQTVQKPLSLPALIAAPFLTIALYALGYLFPGREDKLYLILWVTGVALTALLYLINLLAEIRDKKWMQRMDRDWHVFMEEVFSRKSSLDADLDRATRKLKRRSSLAWCYYGAVLCLMAFLILFLRPAGIHYLVEIPFVILLMGLLCACFNREKPAKPEQALDRKDYPVLYGLADKAAQAVGCRAPVQIFLGSHSVGVFHADKTVWLLLDPIVCSLLTKQELYQAFLHEFAHELNGDTEQSRHFERELARWNYKAMNPVMAPGGFLLTVPYLSLNLENSFYQLFIQKHREPLADQESARLGSAQDLVNALAKLNVWDLFDHEPNPRLTEFQFYESEQPREDYPAYRLEVFRSELPTKEAAWRHQLDVELPPRISTHPIFRERREALGIKDYRLDSAETDENYIRECKALLDFHGKEMAKTLAEDYEKIRKSLYLDRKALIDKAKTVQDWNALSVDERIELADALSVLEPDLEETAIRSILDEDPENSYGVMLLASKRFRENDPQCVALLKQAAKQNFNFASQAYEMLGAYAARNGDQELLDEYRNDIADVLQDARDTQEETSLEWNDREVLTESHLDSALAEEIRKAILERTEGKLKNLYTVEKQTSTEPDYIYILEFPESESPEERERLYEKAFLYLDYREELFALYDITGEKSRLDYLLKKVPGCALSTELPESKAEE